MTTVYAQGIVLDPELYKKLGSPSRAYLLLIGLDAIIIPGPEGYLIRTHREKPTLIIKSRQLPRFLKPGAYEATVSMEHGHMAYKVMGCALDYHFNYTRFKGT